MRFVSHLSSHISFRFCSVSRFSGIPVYFLRQILYKYILLVRIICEKYRLRGEANFPNRLSGEGNFSCPRNQYFSQITLTNRIYLFNFAEYLTVSKTVACKQHCRLEPRNHSVGFFFTIKINPVKFKITADTVVCHFSLLYR